ncbi:ABC transporter ATP-binding protein [Rubrivirga sp. S365]|uniref:ABC transporter ATP-binding protein n=1 Tax=Rubrivirga litoralis TaxID=3075598 RepID=A0ABU3BLS9_9BACT|nr:MULTISPECIES: ABC transporter ATP-binding protein [unclassified Rubrivirga]MDT0630200.1 ABC transporter ATP-binding protein [Rubrivirga sp. F394]MDT7855711.1 ABC transporter ATP-binding protein [Rubrivirga sp. S365]
MLSLSLAPLLTVAPERRRPLVVDGVTKKYVGGPFVLRDLSHTFAPGTATGLVGPNGSGKSTLLRILSALSVPTAGRVLLGGVGGVDAHAAPHRYLASVGVVHDQPDLPGFLSAVETLEWIARERGTWNDAAPPRHEALLDAVLLDERRAQRTGTYSAGMTRKAQLAAAFVGAPSVLLLDEPFRGLDTAATEAALGLLEAFRDGGGVVVLSSHRADLLERVCDGVLNLGRSAPPEPPV